MMKNLLMSKKRNFIFFLFFFFFILMLEFFFFFLYLLFFSHVYENIARSLEQVSGNVKRKTASRNVSLPPPVIVKKKTERERKIA